MELPEYFHATIMVAFYILIIIILEGIDNINLRHKCPLLPARFSQEFFNISNFSSPLLTVKIQLIKIISSNTFQK